MFSTSSFASPYSSFFTSGLLSSTTSRSPSPDISISPRRGSLPTNAPLRMTTSVADESAAFYFTLQPKRDVIEYRSFLSLDLAESQSMRSASLKRKASSKANSRSSKPSKPSVSYPRIPEEPRLLAPSQNPLRLRLSRDSLRSIPSPKPAPSITLPDVPSQPKRSPTPMSSAPPRLPSIPTLPSLEVTLPRGSPIAITRSIAPTDFITLPRRVSVMTSSTVSTRVRRINRSAALARLEGRSKSADLPQVKPLSPRNFMSMSDDEDEADSDFDLLDSDDEKSQQPNPILEFEDVILPSASLSPPKAARSGSSTPSQSSSSRRRKHHKRSTTKDWFPLKSFIDLHNDDDSWSWRSFIEVAHLS
ncbi:uncharacterized protein LACBIDRAFT_305491 [Laccaria bicolor S238N-H82]|uniref:Predicted protein n=1 Tax=Laccaria bicolor (strain S238N-H82 / ATCC MYA-4686) TaxID=486041 RepID=B0CUD2_LACBS|nr:uncharacterized protein LACBIDRAFT_305491 [Laccaria bicolor S238N-H82]EDR14647.1 predicted protein [Laccaria bicolor S238N-H82]|eukprot:XP_001875206.1 predicted protein [Laccaria bicolor S238N-H82]